MFRKLSSRLICAALAAVLMASAAAATGEDASESAVFFTREEIFTARDLRQEADLLVATPLTVTDGARIQIGTAGVYVLSGEANEACVTVQAGNEDKVQLVLDGLKITNAGTPCIHIASADKVFITTLPGSVNALTVTGAFSVSQDAVIFARDDLVLNGQGKLIIRSSQNGVSARNDLKITGGEYVLSSGDAAFESRESICISGGAVTMENSKDGLHSESSSDDELGYIYIAGGSLQINSLDDAVHAQSVFQMDAGTLVLQAHEGIESTRVQINGGSLFITASDDCINAGRKSPAYEPAIQINGGTLSVRALSASSDALDANGDIFINGGSVEITADHPFDYDGVALLTGGTLMVNGKAWHEILR